MARFKIKTFDIELSAYGYGMMALSTAIVILLVNGFFQKTGPDLFATWFTVLLAFASGALAVLMIRTNLPHLKKPVALTYITLMFIILLGGYLTSFFGYSEAYILFFLHPLPQQSFSFAKFVHGLGQVWLAVTATAIISTLAYLFLQLITPSGTPTSEVTVETDGIPE